MSGGLSLHQRVEWRDGGKRLTGTVAVIWNNGADGIVHTDTGAVMPVTAKQVGVPTHTVEVDIDLDEAEALALQVLSRKPAQGSVTRQMLLLAAAVVKLRLQPEVPS